MDLLTFMHPSSITITPDKPLIGFATASRILVQVANFEVFDLDKKTNEPITFQVANDKGNMVISVFEKDLKRFQKLNPSNCLSVVADYVIEDGKLYLPGSDIECWTVYSKEDYLCN